MRETKTYKDRLRTYISEDEVYQKYKKGETNFNDFDKFCIQHCTDIEEMLQDNQILRIKASARETEYYKLKEIINDIAKCFSDGHFEDGCDCLIIEKYIDKCLKEVSE